MDLAIEASQCEVIFNRRISSTILAGAFVALFAGVLLVSLAILLFRQQEEASRFTSENVVYAVAEAEFELTRLYVALGREPTADVNLDTETLRLRADILWSRLDVLQKGEIGRQFASFGIGLDTVSDLKTEVDRFAEGLPRTAAGSARSESSARFRRYFAPIRKLTIDTNHKNQELVSIEAETTTQLHYIIVGGFLGVVFGGAFLVWLQARTRLRERKASERLAAVDALSKAKSEFVAVVGHEVRTPINGVLGMARLLLDTPLNGKQRGYAETIVHSSESLLRILNDLLDVSKLEAGKLELESIPFEPRRVLEDAIAIMANRAEEKGLILRSDVSGEVPGILLGDPNRLRQIMLNLLSNAVKFTVEGTVDVSLAAHEGNDRVMLRLAVRDTGPGISAEIQRKLFSPYAQASADVSRKHGGTGLGLAICRRLADLMGGEIVLESAPGKGSAFILAAPFDRSGEAEPETFEPLSGAKPAAAGVQPLRILLAEDDEVNRRVAVGMLAGQGHEVEFAPNGESAVAMVNAEEFDLVLMDRHMPVLDGLEATRRIRAMEEPIASIPIVGVTAAASQAEIQACLDSGMDHVVSKPFNPVELALALTRGGGAAPARRNGGETRANDDASERRERLGTLSEHEPEKEPRGMVFDPSALARLSDQIGRDSMEEIVAKFVNVSGASVMEFESALSDGDVETATRRAHDLKSAALTLGLVRLSELCRELELGCAHEKLRDVEQASLGLRAEFDVAAAALAQRQF